MSYAKSSSHSKKLADQIEITQDEQPKVSKSNNKSKSGIIYPKFDLKPFGAQITAQQFRDGLLNVRRLDKKGVSIPVVRAANSLGLPFNKATFTFTYPDSRSAADETMYKALVISEMKGYYEPTETMFRSNGTRDGLLKRMSKQLIIKNQNTSASSEYMVKRCSMFLPVKTDYMWLNQISISDPCFDSVNMKADAGFPYIFETTGQSSCPKVGGITNLALEYRQGKDPVPLLTTSMNITKHAIYWSRKIWKIMDEANDLSDAFMKLAGFFDEYPELRTFLLKRKDEKMERDEFLTKVRPYGCMPLPTRFFCSWAVGPWEQQVQNFLENKNSISAYHFSPFYGGAVRLIEHFEHHYNENKRKFFGISYGDDQLWCIRCSDNSVIFLTPDVSAMDMNTQSDSIAFLSKYIKRVFPNIPDMNHRCFVSAISMAFIHSFHVGGPWILTKDQSLFSGVNGTTLINIANSARVQTIVEDVVESYGEPITAQNVFKVLAKAFGAVKNVLGYTFKGFEAIGLEVANMTSDSLWDKYGGSVHSTEITRLRTHGLPLPFLSMKIVVIDEKPVCVPFDQFKLGASLVLPKNCPEKKKIQYELERLVGIAFSGGWFDQQFHTFVQKTYSNLKQLEHQEKDVLSFSELDPFLEQETLALIESVGLTEIPDREYFIDLNFMSKIDFLNKYHAKSDSNNTPAVASKAMTSGNGKNEVTSSASSIENFSSTYSEILDELTQLDTKIIKAPEVDPKKGGKANALNVEQEAEKLRKREIRWAKARARRFVDSLSEKSKRDIKDSINIENDFDLKEFDEIMSVFQDEFVEEEQETFNKFKNEEYQNDNWVDYRQEYNLDDDFEVDNNDDQEDNEYEFGKFNYLNDDM
jgi:hypothetical protein